MNYNSGANRHTETDTVTNTDKQTRGGREREREARAGTHTRARARASVSGGNARIFSPVKTETTGTSADLLRLYFRLLHNPGALTQSVFDASVKTCGSPCARKSNASQSSLTGSKRCLIDTASLRIDKLVKKITMQIASTQMLGKLSPSSIIDPLPMMIE